ncbi:hypothetical protein T03_4147 [Trichinella britovi]|uniref:Uncharacterized protein n=1 Tax=Trichinella britovi TaxID=45882 RepID=A0A0V1CWJ0_TRIBR|nr:hypothetical protein T03_4147 [Trichinella britovi]
MHPQQWPAWGRPGAVVFMLAVILFLLIPFAELVAQSRITQARLRPPHLIDQQQDATNTRKVGVREYIITQSNIFQQKTTPRNKCTDCARTEPPDVL